VWLVVADAPNARWAPRRVEAALRDLDWVSTAAYAHEAIIEAVRRHATIVPMKLLTLFTSDAAAVAHVKKSARKLARIFTLVDGREEWGVRVQLDVGRAARLARAKAQSEGDGLSRGTAFLARKKSERDAAIDLAGGARPRADLVFAELSRLAHRAVRRERTAAEAGTTTVLEASFLVARGDQRRFQAAASAIAGRIRDQGLDLAVTGPWAPYHFVGASR
jgi:hypothetical protein